MMTSLSVVLWVTLALMGSLLTTAILLICARKETAQTPILPQRESDLIRQALNERPAVNPEFQLFSLEIERF